MSEERTSNENQGEDQLQQNNSPTEKSNGSSDNPSLLSRMFTPGVPKSLKKASFKEKFKYAVGNFKYRALGAVIIGLIVFKIADKIIRKSVKVVAKKRANKMTADILKKVNSDAAAHENLSDAKMIKTYEKAKAGDKEAWSKSEGFFRNHVKKSRERKSHKLIDKESRKFKKNNADLIKEIRQKKLELITLKTKAWIKTKADTAKNFAKEKTEGIKKDYQKGVFSFKALFNRDHKKRLLGYIKEADKYITGAHAVFAKFGKLVPQDTSILDAIVGWRTNIKYTSLHSFNKELAKAESDDAKINLIIRKSFKMAEDSSRTDVTNSMRISSLNRSALKSLETKRRYISQLSSAQSRLSSLNTTSIDRNISNITNQIAKLETQLGNIDKEKDPQSYGAVLSQIEGAKIQLSGLEVQKGQILSQRASTESEIVSIKKRIESSDYDIEKYKNEIQRTQQALMMNKIRLGDSLRKLSFEKDTIQLSESKKRFSSIIEAIKESHQSIYDLNKQVLESIPQTSKALQNINSNNTHCMEILQKMISNSADTAELYKKSFEAAQNNEADLYGHSVSVINKLQENLHDRFDATVQSFKARFDSEDEARELDTNETRKTYGQLCNEMKEEVSKKILDGVEYSDQDIKKHLDEEAAKRHENLVELNERLSKELLETKVKTGEISKLNQEEVTELMKDENSQLREAAIEKAPKMMAELMADQMVDVMMKAIKPIMLKVVAIIGMIYALQDFIEILVIDPLVYMYKYIFSGQMLADIGCFFKNLWIDLKTLFGDLWIDFQTWGANLWDKLSTWFADLPDLLVYKIKSNINAILETIEKAVFLIKKIPSILGELFKAYIDIVKYVLLNPLAKLFSDWSIMGVELTPPYEEIKKSWGLDKGEASLKRLLNGSLFKDIYNGIKNDPELVEISEKYAAKEQQLKADYEQKHTARIEARDARIAERIQIRDESKALRHQEAEADKQANKDKAANIMDRWEFAKGAEKLYKKYLEKFGGNAYAALIALLQDIYAGKVDGGQFQIDGISATNLIADNPQNYDIFLDKLIEKYGTAGKNWEWAVALETYRGSTTVDPNSGLSVSDVESSALIKAYGIDTMNKIGHPKVESVSIDIPMTPVATNVGTGKIEESVDISPASPTADPDLVIEANKESLAKDLTDAISEKSKPEIKVLPIVGNSSTSVVPVKEARPVEMVEAGSALD